MAKLSKSVLEEGRAHVRSRDLKSLRLWQDTNIPAWRRSSVEQHFERAYEKDSSGTLALKLFDRVYTDIDPVEENAKAVLSLVTLAVKLVVVLVLLVGAIGGIVYLFQL